MLQSAGGFVLKGLASVPIRSGIQTKSVEPNLSFVPHSKGLRIARSVETNNEKAPRDDISFPHLPARTNQMQLRKFNSIFKGRFRCFVFD